MADTLKILLLPPQYELQVLTKTWNPISLIGSYAYMKSSLRESHCKCEIHKIMKFKPFDLVFLFNLPNHLHTLYNNALEKQYW